MFGLCFFSLVVRFWLDEINKAASQSLMRQPCRAYGRRLSAMPVIFRPAYRDAGSSKGSGI